MIGVRTFQSGTVFLTNQIRFSATRKGREFTTLQFTKAGGEQTIMDEAKSVPPWSQLFDSNSVLSVKVMKKEPDLRATTEVERTKIRLFGGRERARREGGLALIQLSRRSGT